MSIFGTMKTGVSGMNAQANRLATVGDNIANSSTIGYKRASTAFSSMVLPSSGGNYNSGGVSSNIRYSISESGGYSYTTSATDLAIEGNGFFIVAESRDPDAAQFLTRAGNFSRETVEEPAGSGLYKTFLKNAAGYYLFTPSQATASSNRFSGSVVEMPGNEIKSTPTTAGTMKFNLNNQTEIAPAAPAVPTDANKWKTSMTGFGYQGIEIVYDFTFTRTGANAWTLDITNAKTGLAAATPVSLTFNPTTGALVTPAAPFTIPAVTDQNGPIVVDLAGSVTQNTGSTIMSGGLNGNGASAVKDVIIENDGSIYIQYQNGSKVLTESRLMLATVTSPDNLNPVNGNAYSASNTSGILIANDPGTKGVGDLMTKTLETSNVDIANELTEMIESQRIYSANSKVFQTGSELLDVLVNLKR